MLHSLSENEKCELRWKFVIQTNHRVQTRNPDLVIILKKKRCHIMYFV